MCFIAHTHPSKCYNKSKTKIYKKKAKNGQNTNRHEYDGRMDGNKRKSVELQKKRNARTRMNFYVDFLFIRICIIFILRFRLLLFLFNFVHLFRMHSIIRVIVLPLSLDAMTECTFPNLLNLLCA